LLAASLCAFAGPFASHAGADESAARSCADDSPVAIPEGALFGEVRIDNRDVFDTDDPAEDRRLYRVANAIHVKTRPAVVERRLLFDSGDPWSLQVLHESERLLRSAGYLYDARICVLAYHDGVVDVSVQARDVWTLRPSISFGRSGGQNKGSIGLEEENLLGTGISVTFEEKRDVDRDSTIVGFSQPNLLGRWLNLDTSYTDSSDGRTFQLGLEQPFYALDTRRARGLRLTEDDRLDPMYERGEITDEFRHQTSYQRLYWGWSAGLQHGWTQRWSVGAVHDFERFSPSTGEVPTTLLPDDRKLQYPFFAFERVRDHYVTAHNTNQIARTEDFYLGPRFYGEIGLLADALGSDRDGLTFDGLWSYGLERTDATRWIASAELSGRAETADGLVDSVASASVQFYHRQSGRWLLYSSAQADVAHDLDLDHQLLIGGDNGLRGYPLRYQGGDRRALFTIEERYFTSWYPFRLFHVAAAAFFDVGHAWGTNPFATEDLGWLRDVGFGARFGSSRSGKGTMVHVDLAFPLDGDSSIDQVQLVIETKHGF
jgi:hypothetical protein